MADRLGDYFIKLRDENHSGGFLGMTMSLGNEAVLVNSEIRKESQVIYYNPGRSITKPNLSSSQCRDVFREVVNSRI